MWIQVQHINPVWYFDATGSIIQDIPGEKKPLLYSMVCHDTDTNSIIPVFEFVTTSHSEDNLAKYLSIMRRKLHREIPSSRFYPIAPIVVMDFSWASINAVCDGFNMCNISQYIRWAYDVIFKESETISAINVLIYLCSTHMLKSTVDKVKKIQVNEIRNRDKKTIEEREVQKKYEH
jgi:hypothetical protein